MIVIVHGHLTPTMHEQLEDDIRDLLEKKYSLGAFTLYNTKTSNTTTPEKGCAKELICLGCHNPTILIEVCSECGTAGIVGI